MALPKSITVKESLKELKQLQKSSKPLFIPRLRMLFVIKQSEQVMSKNTLAEKVGVNHNSIQNWRKMYEEGGLAGLLAHKTNASRPFIFTQEEQAQIRQKLEDPKNGLRGYKELQSWIFDNLNRTVKYNTLVVFCRQQLGTKIKVARKSHVKKDEEAVNTFKKTLVTSVKE